MPALVLSSLAFLFVVGNGFRKLGYLHFDVLFVVWIDGGVVGKGQDGEALCSVIDLVVFFVTLFLLQRFLDTIFHSFVLVLSFNPPHHCLLSSSGYPPQLGCEFAAWFELDF
jgi:hypothetical protein